MGTAGSKQSAGVLVCLLFISKTSSRASKTFLSEAEECVLSSCVCARWIIELQYMKSSTAWETDGSKMSLCIEKINILNIFFYVCQIKFFGMHATSQQLHFDVFTVVHLQNVFMEHDLYFLSLQCVDQN